MYSSLYRKYRANTELLLHSCDLLFVGSELCCTIADHSIHWRAVVNHRMLEANYYGTVMRAGQR